MAGSEAKWTFAQKFYADFNATASELASRLDMALESDLDVAPATIQALTSDLSHLMKSLSDATGSLPGYDQKRCELRLKGLEKRIEELRGASAGVPKFSFKRKATKLKLKPPTAAEQAPVVAVSDESRSTMIESARTLTGFSHRYLTILDVRPCNSSAEVSISDLDNCIVNLLSGDENRVQLTALYVQRVSRSVVLLPEIPSSILLHDMSECVIVVGCHQFRMHNSAVVDVYLESGSDPVIEHCSGIRFASYPNQIVRGRGLQGSKHFAVKDFSHILSTPSPNWSPLLEDKWSRSWPIEVLQDLALQEQLERMLPTRSRPLENSP